MPPRTRTATKIPAHDDKPGAAASAAADDAHTAPAASTSAIAGFRLPLPMLDQLDAKRLLWFGGLGVLATIGILDWPVALVVGAGTLIARSRPATIPDQPQSPRKLET